MMDVPVGRMAHWLFGRFSPEQRQELYTVLKKRGVRAGLVLLCVVIVVLILLGSLFTASVPTIEDPSHPVGRGSRDAPAPSNRVVEPEDQLASVENAPAAAFEPWMVEDLQDRAYEGDFNCPVPGVPRGVSVSVIVDGLQVPASVPFAGELLMFPVGDAGTATLVVHGFQPTVLSWMQSENGLTECSVGDLVVAKQSFVFGTVSLADGLMVPDVRIVGCGGSAKTNEGGEFELPRVMSGACSLHASGGGLGTLVADVFVPESDDDVIVSMYAIEMAVVGVVVNPTDYLNGNWLVHEVVAGSPVDRIGIREADVILEASGGTNLEVQFEPAETVLSGGGYTQVEIRAYIEHRASLY
jgi:hypothetical protein